MGFGAQMMQAQYIPATAPETLYDNLVASSCSNNDVGTDTRSGMTGFGGYGFGSPHYGNFLNVTVNSCLGIAAGGNPGFYWESSAGTSGSSALPQSAFDPDVVLISPGPMASPADVDRIFAIAVYYLPDSLSYCMSISEFNTGTNTFAPMSGPMFIQNYAGSQPHINIDADHYGHYGVVMQMTGGILSRTQTVLTVPTTPTNDVFQPGLIEPDIAYLNNTAMEAHIIGLSGSRNQYRTFTRGYLGGSYSFYSSPLLPELYEPRIAAPSFGIFSEYAITVARKYPVIGGANYDILFQVDEGVIAVANDGSVPFYPNAINFNNTNVYPCLTYDYYYSGGSLAEQLSLGWFAEGVPGDTSVPNQPSTFIGIDIDPNIATYPISTPFYYMDISNMNGQNNESVMALSGRFSDWGKSAAFTYDNITPGFGEMLMWKQVGSPSTSWKTDADQATVTEALKDEIKLYPNPAKNQVSLAFGNTEVGFSYEVFNQLGQSVLAKRTGTAKVTIDVQDLPSGLYFVTIQNKESKAVSNLKFVKE